MFKMLIAAGHGAGPAHNRGSVCGNEGDQNYHYCVALKNEMDKFKDVKVDLLRNSINYNPSLTQRAAAGTGYDFYYGAHSNAVTGNPSVRGSEVWDSVEKPNLPLAKAICDASAESFKHNNRGVKYKEGQKGWNWYGELRLNGAKSAMIVEHGFHTNSVDCSHYKVNKDSLAKEVAAAIAAHYRLERKEDGKVVADEPSKYAVEAWKWATKTGLLDGTRPKEPMTREMYAMVEYRKRGK